MLFELLFFGVPIASCLFFGVSLGLYFSARKRKKRGDETLTVGAYCLRRDLLIASSVLFGVVTFLTLLLVGLILSVAIVGM